MVVLVLRNVKAGLKGQVTRWLSEVGVGVYLGAVSARVREKLWERVTKGVGEGGAVLIYSNQTEQGYSVMSAGSLPYTFEDFEGLTLAKRVAAA